ncbi:MAG: GGDEF domain-containing protein [Pirellulaceae bacterium]|nr:GGDEF domain-containing protein [Pirellulaceae bacterium]
MPTNTTVFLLGLAAGSLLLVLGLGLGFWFGKKAGVAGSPVQGQQFLALLRSMSQWTSELSGDVVKYQNQLSNIDQRVRSGTAHPEEMMNMVSQMMETNRQLQARLETTELKLDTQTDQLASYLKEARTDGLTGLMNRKAFDKTTDELFVQWQKHSKPFCLGLVDIDHFKKINDTYGHPAGDQVLKQVAVLMQSELTDLVCIARYGGEEFGFLTLTPLAEAAAQLERFRRSLAKIQVEFEQHAITMTLSGGVAQIVPNERIGLLVRRADEALYAAKTGGRNRVYIHNGQSCQLISQVPSGQHTTPAVPPASHTDPHPADPPSLHIQQRLKRIVEEESQRVGGR